MTGLYFGSFNPVHLGHTNLAQYLINSGICDEVWFVISPSNPLKDQNELVNEDLRLRMLEMAIEDNNSLKACDIEFSMPKPSYTIDTLHELKLRYPNKNFILLIGSDNAVIFDKWKDPYQILNMMPVYVYPRRNFDFNSVKALYPQMKAIDSPYFDISSTEIRYWIQQKKDASNWLHPSVLQYIIENKLYQ